MGRGKGIFGWRAWLAAGLLLACYGGAASAEYPRRVAIAPFSVLTPQEDLRNIVTVLPRLLSSRLMALSGAEVLLLPPGETPPEEAAKRAGFPLLLQGTVAKLGAGYSIDLSAADLSGGKTAGAFFASADTIDAIIPRLGDLAADVSEKLFGVKTAARAYPPPPAAQPASPGIPMAVTAGPQAAAAAPAPSLPAAPATPAQGWVPSSMNRIGQSDKVADELYGVVAGNTDEEGNGEVVAWGKNILYFYRVKGEEILPVTRITKDLTHHILNVESIDLDGDGLRELLVTDLVTENIRSFVLRKSGDVYQEVAVDIPYFLVVLPDWEGGRVVVGQRAGMDTPFFGKILRMTWDGTTFKEGVPFPADTNILPLAHGILGLSSGRFGSEWKLIYTDASSRLRILEAGGKSEFKSIDKFGTALDYFEWGPMQILEGRRPRYSLRKSPRLADAGQGAPLLVIPEVEKGMLDVTAGSFDSTRLVVLRWENGDLVEKAASPKSKYFYSGADLLAAGGTRKGGKLVASLIEQEGSAIKGRISRLVLYRLE